MQEEHDFRMVRLQLGYSYSLRLSPKIGVYLFSKIALTINYLKEV